MHNPARWLAVTAVCLVPLMPLSAEDRETPATKVTLKDATWEDVQTYIAAQKGKVVVLDLWSTGCPPCMKEFPHLVKLHSKHRGKVVCVSLNVDYVGIKKRPPSHYRPLVEKFLKSRKATITNFMATIESDEVLTKAGVFSIPAVFVYNTDGKLAKRFDDSLIKPGKDEAFTYEADVNPLVDKLALQVKQ